MYSASASSAASSALNSNGASWGVDNSGWNVNMGGSSLQAAGGINWVYVAIAAAAWFLLRK